jgi:hypothetical protein
MLVAMSEAISLLCAVRCLLLQNIFVSASQIPKQTPKKASLKATAESVDKESNAYEFASSTVDLMVAFLGHDDEVSRILRNLRSEMSNAEARGKAYPRRPHEAHHGKWMQNPPAWRRVIWWREMELY